MNCIFASIPVWASSMLKYSTKVRSITEWACSSLPARHAQRVSQCHTTLKPALHSWMLSHRIQTVICRRGSHRHEYPTWCKYPLWGRQSIIQTKFTIWKGSYSSGGNASIDATKATSFPKSLGTLQPGFYSIQRKKDQVDKDASNSTSLHDKNQRVKYINVHRS